MIREGILILTDNNDYSFKYLLPVSCFDELRTSWKWWEVKLILKHNNDHSSKYLLAVSCFDEMRTSWKWQEVKSVLDKKNVDFTKYLHTVCVLCWWDANIMKWWEK